jgi:hypothetical protein
MLECVAENATVLDAASLIQATLAAESIAALNAVLQLLDTEKFFAIEVNRDIAVRTYLNC